MGEASIRILWMPGTRGVSEVEMETDGNSWLEDAGSRLSARFASTAMCAVSCERWG